MTRIIFVILTETKIIFETPVHLPDKIQECFHTITLSEWPVAVARSFPLFQSQIHTVFLASSPTEAKRWGKTTAIQLTGNQPLITQRQFPGLCAKMAFPTCDLDLNHIPKAQTFTLNIYSLKRALKRLIFSKRSGYGFQATNAPNEILTLKHLRCLFQVHTSLALIY